MPMHLIAIDAVRTALPGNPFAVCIGADQADAGQRKGRAQSREIDQKIERTAPVGDRFRRDIGQRILLRISVDKFDFINDPIAACENAGTIFHDGLRTVESFYFTSTARFS